MKLGANEFNILIYLLSKNEMSYKQAIEWAYDQYTEHGEDEFVEKVSLATDASEIRELVANAFQVYGEPSAEFLAGEVASKYSKGNCSLYEAISRVLFDLDLDLPETEKQELYIAEDYFGWHDSPETKAYIHVEPIFKNYMPIYKSAIAKFGV